MSSRHFAPVVAVFAAVLAAATPAAARQPSQLIVFGDSLVDAGNLDVAVGSDMYNPVAKGYFPGRFTNGPDYTDLLSQRLYGSYQTPSLLGGTNYAFGGARVVNTGDFVPDLTAQLGAYASGHAVDPNALYIINLGGNDVFGLNAGQTGGLSPAAYTTALLDTMAGAVQYLDARGAGRILVTGIPNVAPSVPDLDQQLQLRLDSLTLVNADLLRFDYLDFFARLRADPLHFGVAPITNPGACFDFRTPVGGSIDCSGFGTVDGIHPIAPIQAAIFREVAHITGVGTVPEPSTWALMIGGFGLVGFGMRRRQAVAA